ncbi:SDR family oxidoreductase [Microbacterium sp. C7(2022)]|uniref:SDR family NAD(P)-dependent oxidoreductase n=1 Tax=Microbacterium sp. C7(2022) TaxID=2992759 RepID=UPI00237B2568|nr:SDR family oxidoreductase [Microbacterium sp. C7(2022)]MDE0545135.1 SDR family oxidoreductase [Microbacterium sp. C7(2022)]
MQISDKVFVVTGGGNGIGREVALELLRRGARVAAVDLNEAGLADTAALAPTAGTRISTHAVNIADRAAVEALPAAVIEAHGQIDGIVNVAGIIQPFVRLHELPYEQIERVMNVNFWGTVHIDKSFLPHLLERPEASLVNVSSMSALVPVPGQSAYGASKSAVKSLTEGLHAELRGTNVAVTVVFPGAVGTNITGNSGVTTPGGAAAEAGKEHKTTSPVDAGRQIVEAIAKGTPRVRIGGDARMLDRLGRLMPTKAIELIADKMKDLLDREPAASGR